MESKILIKLYDYYPIEEIGQITEKMIAEGDFVTERDQQLENNQKPKIARACPVRVMLTKGQSYLYCTCGHSQFQPFCDGSHKNEAPDYKPLKVDITKDQKSFIWCACKRNKISAGANCDGQHSRIDW